MPPLVDLAALQEQYPDVKGGLQSRAQASITLSSRAVRMSRNIICAGTVVAVLKADVSMFPFQQVSFQEPDGLFFYTVQAKDLELFDNGKILQRMT